MALSEKVARFVQEGGWIRKMFEAGISLKQQYGDDKVFDLSLGNPVVEPPAEFRAELQRLAASETPGMHRYMPNAGYADTREAVAAGIREEAGVDMTGAEIVMTAGAAAGLNVALKTILNPGDEVIIFAPYFVEYVYYTDNHGGVSVTAPTDAAFQPDLAALEALITPKTRALLINSPNNPSGAVYGSDTLAELGDLLRVKSARFDSEIFLISDEPYRRIIYDGLSYPHVYLHYETSMVVHSHAKDLALPGERIGYIAVNPAYEGKSDLADGLTFCNRILGIVNAPALMQHVVKALQGVTVDVSDYQRKRDFIHGALTDLGYDCFRPQGAFYLFPKAPGEDDLAFVDELQRYNVLVVPGRGFGQPGHFRVSYCLEDRVLEGSLEGFAAAARRFGL